MHNCSFRSLAYFMKGQVWKTSYFNLAFALPVKIDKQLKFKSHIEELYRKTAYKLHPLRRIRKYLTVKKAKFLANAFINSQFTCVPLI